LRDTPDPEEFGRWLDERDHHTEKTVDLGPEYDEESQKILKSVLEEAKAVRVGFHYGIAGSQEIALWKYQFGTDTLFVMTETHMGLTVSGPAEKVDSIAAEVKRRIDKRSTE